MNQGRIWCVVNPTVGLPLFLGSVAVTSLIVHACVLTHVSWFGNYWQGKAARTALNTSTAAPTSFTSAAQPGFTVSVNPVASTSAGGASFVVSVSPSSVQTAKAASPTPVSLAAK